MIRLVPGQFNVKTGASRTVFTPGRLLTVQVKEADGTGVRIVIDGKTYRVSSDIPLKRGDIFMARVLNGPRGIELKILQQVFTAAGGSAAGLDTLLAQEPALARALIRSGLPLKEENLRRFRTILNRHKERSRDESSRILAILEEKGLLSLAERGLPLFFGQDKRHDDREEQQDHEKWSSRPVSPRTVREILCREDTHGNEVSLFNHTKSASDHHWLIIPFRVLIQEVPYRGELRLNIRISEKSLTEGTLVLRPENSAQGGEWIFGLTEKPERKIYLVRSPENEARENLPGFAEKMRKLGFDLVDTFSMEEFDGFSLTELTVNRGIDAQI